MIRSAAPATSSTSSIQWRRPNRSRKAGAARPGRFRAGGGSGRALRVSWESPSAVTAIRRAQSRKDHRPAAVCSEGRTARPRPSLRCTVRRDPPRSPVRTGEIRRDAHPPFCLSTLSVGDRTYDRNYDDPGTCAVASVRLTAAARCRRGPGSAVDLWSPLPPGDGCCPVCRGPVRPGYPRCFQCAMHRADAHGWLADVVGPISYAAQGGPPYSRLCQYKADDPDAAAARAVLRAVLLTFLREHGPCVWRRAGMPPPARLAVVPSGQGRPGPHPLTGLLAPLGLPAGPLAGRPGEPLERALNPHRFRAGAAGAGRSVLLVDDTWVSGSSAQSAAVALRMAGARHVAVAVLGRHVDPADRHSAALLDRIEARGYDEADCAVHAP